MAKRRYIIYCDESDQKGPKFSNFYGGALIRSTDREALEDLLLSKKQELNLGREVKWQRVSATYLEKYKEFISYYFEFVSTGRIKIRIMFRQNIHVPIGLSEEQKESEYLLLYYQFIKHAFGIKYSNPNALDRVYFSILADQIPDNANKIRRFRSRISSIPETPAMRGCQLFIPYHEIGEIDCERPPAESRWLQVTA